MESKSQPRSESQREEANLDRRYGEIGISAVAAALHYQCEAKNTAYAPVTPRDDKRYAELAA